MTDLPLSDAIREANRDVWDAMQAHRFVRDIEADTLPASVFRRYLAYEHAFVETAITIFGYALVKAPGFPEQRRLAGVLRALAEDQIPYFMDAFATLGMAEAEWRDIALPPAVGAFRDGMLAIAAHGTYEDVVAAMLAAEWMYWTWCDRAAKRPASEPVLRRWVDLHAAPDFADQARWLRNQIDAAGRHMAPAARRRVSRIFGRALALEIDFHTAPYEG